MSLGYDDDLLYEQRLLREAMPHRVFHGQQALEHGVKGMKWGVRKDRSSKADKTKKLAADPKTLGMMQVEKWGQKQQTPKEIQGAIEAAASAGQVLKISYQKSGEDKPHTYAVEPYSFRGTKFFAFDRGDTREHAKSFDFNSIVAAKATKKTYKPRWPVEIGHKKESGLRESAHNKAERVRLATETHVPQTKRKYGLTKINEAELARIVAGATSTAKSPFDVYVGNHAIEVKTIEKGKNDRIIVHPSSLRTKTLHASKRGLTTHTVVFDARPGKEAVYYREGLGSFRLNQMRKLPSIESIRETIEGSEVDAIANANRSENSAIQREVIHKTGKGFQVRSEKGKNLSKPGLSKGAAKKRLAQVEYFKHHKENGSDAVLNPVLRGEDLLPMAEAGYAQQNVVNGEVHNNAGLFESTRPIESNEFIHFDFGFSHLREGGPGSGDHGHEGRPGEVGGSGGGGAEAPKKQRSPNRPIGVKYGFAPGMMKKGFKNDIAHEMFGKKYGELENHQKSALKRELRNRGVVRPQGKTEASADEKKLMSADIQGHKEDIGGGHVNDAYKVHLEGGGRAVFKPQDPRAHSMRQNISTGHDAEREAGAWQVAKLAGLEGIAAPCVVRTIDGQKGSLQKMWDGKEAGKVSKPFDGVEDMCKAAAFDYVIGNEDRHMYNWLVSDQEKLQLIDHGLCFPDRGSYGEAGDRNHKLLAECANRERNNNLQGAPKISDIAKVYTEKKNEIISALQKVGVPVEGINGVRQRIERMARKDKWEDLNKKGKYAW